MTIDFTLIKDKVVGKDGLKDITFEEYVNTQDELKKINNSLGELHFKLQEIFLKELDKDNEMGYDLALNSMYLIEDTYPDSTYPMAQGT
ncbi:MAG: hypothetical protein IIA85_02610 [Nanoarchaeota archaeon]|nr:hypothetical protein [Nanoarchaeota archaeon]